MPLQPLDKFLVQRGTVQYEMTADQLNEFINAGQDLTAISFADLQSGTFIGGKTGRVSDKVFINDASGDPTVESGFAIYRISGVAPITFDKIDEGESLDLVINQTNLAFVPSATGGTVTNDNGNDFVIPLADATNAGLMSPAEKSNIHVAATVATDTPLTIDVNQQVGFDISILPVLP